MPAPAMPEPVVIPLPENFPVQFDPPELQALPFQQDRQHVPLPMSHMSAWFAQNGFAVGASRALATYNVPMAFTVGHFNTYYYMAIAPNIPPEEMPAAEERAQAALMPALATFKQRWDAEWLPELQRTYDDWAKFDLKSASTEALVARLEVAGELFRRIWQIHFELLVPAMVGFSEFRILYGQLFPEQGDLAAYKLLQGFNNKSLEAGRAIWQLSRTVVANPALSALFRGTAPDAIAAQLPATDGGTAFLAEAEKVLATYGRRSDTVQELADPSWTEDSRILFTNIRAYLDQAEDPETHRLAKEKEREAAVAAARAAIANHPEEARGGFEFLLGAAQACSFLQEDHNYWIDQRGLHEVRQLCMELGRRLATAGKLEKADDVFLFSPPELQALLAGAGDGKATAASRRAEMQHFATIPAPPMVGTDYGPPPDNPIVRSITRFFGGPPPGAEGQVLRGNAGSPGKIRGTARVIISLADSDRLEPGDILVTATTSPPWTPLFAFAGGIVTDTGGALSHCAIVAREYGLPAVVGTGMATAMIKDGQQLEVDGDAGTVRLL